MRKILDRYEYRTGKSEMWKIYFVDETGTEVPGYVLLRIYRGKMAIRNQTHNAYSTYPGMLDQMTLHEWLHRNSPEYRLAYAQFERNVDLKYRHQEGKC